MIRQDGKALHGNQTAVLRDQSRVTLLTGGLQGKEVRDKNYVVVMCSGEASKHHLKSKYGNRKEKAMKIRKLLATMLVVVLLFAFATPAFAYTTTVISTNQSASGYDYWHKHGVTRSYSAFSLSGNVSISAYGNATSLTVRAYEENSQGQHTKLSNAKTYRAGALSGGQSYWSLPAKICIKCNNDSQGDWIYVYGTWKF